MEILKDIIDHVQTLGPEALTIGVVIALGYLFRLTPAIDNKYIPVLCVLFGPLAYILIGDSGSVRFTTKNPEVVLAMFGLLYGVIGWILHHHVIWHVEQWFAKRFGKQQKEKNEDIGD